MAKFSYDGFFNEDGARVTSDWLLREKEALEMLFPLDY